MSETTTIEVGDLVRLTTSGLHSEEVGTVCRVHPYENWCDYTVACPSCPDHRPETIFSDLEVTLLDINSLSSGLDNPDHPGHELVEIERHELDALRAEVARLTEALKPFANAAAYDGDVGTAHDNDLVSVTNRNSLVSCAIETGEGMLMVKHLRAAAALEGKAK